MCKKWFVKPPLPSPTPAEICFPTCNNFSIVANYVHYLERMRLVMHLQCQTCQSRGWQRLLDGLHTAEHSLLLPTRCITVKRRARYLIHRTTPKKLVPVDSLTSAQSKNVSLGMANVTFSDAHCVTFYEDDIPTFPCKILLVPEDANGRVWILR